MSYRTEDRATWQQIQKGDREMTLEAQTWLKMVRNGGEDRVQVKNPEMFQPLTQNQWQNAARCPTEGEIHFVSMNKCVAISHRLGTKPELLLLCIEVPCQESVFLTRIRSQKTGTC